eukprot:TRINITY_DN9785_c0_g1_i2.p2 TRINITY_DN9785_c0_g1~~TRINITY_DN9785_c0_g1_i2.p2  ORF type:complete len:145 (+),score=0.16 TRINITY_DN9785_c0_g1_i2:328-762(+)
MLIEFSSFEKPKQLNKNDLKTAKIDVQILNYVKNFHVKKVKQIIQNRYLQISCLGIGVHFIVYCVQLLLLYKQCTTHTKIYKYHRIKYTYKLKKKRIKHETKKVELSSQNQWPLFKFQRFSHNNKTLLQKTTLLRIFTIVDCNL